MISLDETTFNHKIGNNKSWIRKDYSAELFNKFFFGSWSLIIAISSGGSYFGLLINKRINSLIYQQFLENLEGWIDTIRNSNSQKVLILKDNSQVHRVKEVLNFISKSSITNVYLIIYPWILSSRENTCYFKIRCKSFRLRESINL